MIISSTSVKTSHAAACRPRNLRTPPPFRTRSDSSCLLKVRHTTYGRVPATLPSVVRSNDTQVSAHELQIRAKMRECAIFRGRQERLQNTSIKIKSWKGRVTDCRSSESVFDTHTAYKHAEKDQAAERRPEPAARCAVCSLSWAY